VRAAHGLGQEERVRRGDDFRRAFALRCSAGDEWLVIFGCPNELPHARLGLSVGRKWGKAVRRNRVKRLYREAFRLCKPHLPPGIDYIFVPRKVEHLTLAILRTSLPRLARQLADRLNRVSRPP
jgi:ribonuclease P protein component